MASTLLNRYAGGDLVIQGIGVTCPGPLFRCDPIWGCYTLYGDYIELIDLNEPLELRRNQVDELEPTIEEGEVVDEPMMDIVKTRCDDEMIDRLNEYPVTVTLIGKSISTVLIICNFAVVENMDTYRDDGMGDIIVGRPFCRKACVKTRRFDGMITIYKGNDSPLLKVSAQDELKGISHPYQKLKGFYKEVLNLGAEYIRNEKVEEWLTHGYVNYHEIE
ncbi:hypothetical protein Tco_0710147 [Tanacetum coccineum]